MRNIYIALGSNIGRQKNLKRCVGLLKKRFDIIKVSNVYETKPVGYSRQPNFYNMALEIATELSPEELFQELMAIEKKLKRIRRKRNYPRTIDIDILFYNKRIIKANGLIIPHPRLHKRSFVLVPLKDIARKFRHPVLNKTPLELLCNLKTTEIIKKVDITL